MNSFRCRLFICLVPFCILVLDRGMAIPVYDIDFYSDDFILDPLPRYAELRDMGPVVWLSHQNAFAVSRHAECQDVLRRPDIFQSGRGLSLNDAVNKNLIGSTLNSDGDAHRRKRSITATPIMPKNLVPFEADIESRAEALADALVARTEFDAVKDFAQILPLTFVTELIGLPSEGTSRMLAWAAATFDAMEGFNDRSKDALPKLKELRAFLEGYGQKEKLAEGGLAHRIFAEAERLGIPESEAAEQLRDYIPPSLDTTISTLGFAAYYFATCPDQWSAIRRDRDLIPGAIEELVRLATPIRAFSRYVGEDTEVAGAAIPKGSRMIVVYASGNRDERVFENPDTFDVHRNPRKHLGFGHGVHSCMGMHLARMEIRKVLSAMAARVTCWQALDEPTWVMNNSIRAISSLPVRVQ